MKKPLNLFFIFLILLNSVIPVNAWALISSAEDSSEALFFESPATIHNYKSSTDPHNVLLSAVAFTELEFIKIGDALVSLPVKGNVRPFLGTADWVQGMFYRLPQTRSVKKIEQLGDALQLRQFSLSDFRFVSSLANGQLGGSISPIMQTRLNKMVILAEDIVDDLDWFLMLPINETISGATNQPVRIETIGYTADVLGYVRGKVFYVLRIINKAMVKTSSRLVFGVEGATNHYIRHRRGKSGKNYPVYLKMPENVYLEYLSFFKRRAKHLLMKELNRTNEVSNTNSVYITPITEEPSQSLSIRKFQESEKELLIALPMRVWQGAPKALKRYVIDEDEAKTFSEI